MNNLLNLAGLGALGGIIASSWNTIKGQLDKAKQLLFVSTSIHTRALDYHSYLFIRDNYKISFLDRREYVRDHVGGFCRYIKLNNSLVRGKGRTFFWVTIQSRRIDITYIRGFFNIKEFIKDFEVFFKEDMNHSVYTSRTPSIGYIESKETESVSNREGIKPFLTSSADSTDLSNDISVIDLHESMKNTNRDYIVGQAKPESEFKHNYVLPSYLEPTVKEFLNWANPDIRLLFKDILEISSAKGYCLYGPPGTGKSSFIKYLAERAYGMYIDIIQLNTISSKDLVNYFKESKDSNIIRVIEDIDSVFDMRERVDKRLNSTDLTFDVLLNCISGVNSPTSGFIFITTNHIDKVDPALLRAGRLDNVIEIRVPDKGDYEKMYDARLDTLYNFFIRINEEEWFARSYNLKPVSLEQLSIIKQEIDNGKERLVNTAADNKYTTAQFDLILKNKITELYLKYRVPII